MDEPEADLAALWSKMAREGSAVETRRKKEKRGMSHRRRSGQETKSAQFNVKVRPSFKAQVEAWAKSDGVSLSEFVELAVNSYRGMTP